MCWSRCRTLLHFAYMYMYMAPVRWNGWVERHEVMAYGTWHNRITYHIICSTAHTSVYTLRIYYYYYYSCGSNIILDEIPFDGCGPRIDSQLYYTLLQLPSNSNNDHVYVFMRMRYNKCCFCFLLFMRHCEPNAEWALRLNEYETTWAYDFIDLQHIRMFYD